MSAAPAKSPDPSMEEILASIRRIIADDQGDGKARSGGAGEAAPAGHEDEDVLDLAAEPEAAPPSPPDLEIDLPDLSFQEAGEEARPPDRGGPAPAPPVSARAEAPPRVARPAAAGRPEGRLEALISSQTTASVGQAFNLLSHTVMSQNARTLEDLVKEMLKPMLKAWLDDNLPPLVERLVRTEIERVARGGR